MPAAIVLLPLVLAVFWCLTSVKHGERPLTFNSGFKRIFTKSTAALAYLQESIPAIVSISASTDWLAQIKPFKSTVTCHLRHIAPILAIAISSQLHLNQLTFGGQ